MKKLFDTIAILVFVAIHLGIFYLLVTDNFNEKCEAKGGKVLVTESGKQCIDRTAVITIK